MSGDDESLADPPLTLDERAVTQINRTAPATPLRGAGELFYPRSGSTRRYCRSRSPSPWMVVAPARPIERQSP